MNQPLFQGAEVLHKSADLVVKAMPYQLNFRAPFKLAHGSRSHTDVVFLAIGSGDYIGYGEAALPPYLGLSSNDVLAFWRHLPWSDLCHAPLDDALQLVDSALEGHHAAKAAVDIALHDLLSKSQGQSAGQMLGVKSGFNINTTFTIGISTEAELKAKLEEASSFKLIKLKLGSGDDFALVESYLRHSALPFCADANQGCRSKEEALGLADFLLKKGALFLEQPLQVGMEQDSKWISERTALPIIADESVRRLVDLNEVGTCFDGVNIKLMKSTGLAEAHKMIDASRSMGLKVVLGAMAESSCSVTAAAHLAPLADWVDLDGPLLTNNDPFEGLTYHEGALVIPTRWGTGAAPHRI
jgi:L-alanine-DL-glutamate epimerase-like enolase superfamily enzyme